MLFEKIKFNTEQECVRQIRLFNYPILEYYTKYNEQNKRKHVSLFPTLKKRNYSSNSKNAQVFYLKINREENWAFLCLQKWIDIISILDADFYIISDKESLTKKIYKKIRFKNKNIKIIRSFCCLRKKAKKLVHARWVNAAIAHMTTFYHSSENNIKNFWNIDVDDTMFCFSNDKIIELLEKARCYAIKSNINCLSLDMWRSRSNNIHWSFGITFTQNDVDYLSIFDKFSQIDWQKEYSFYNTDMNIDWFFNYLTQYEYVKTYSFYPEKGYFIHWGDLFVNVVGSSICYWRDGFLYYPILKGIAKNDVAGVVPIAKDCVKFDIGLSLNDGIHFLNSELFNFNTNIKK